MFAPGTVIDIHQPFAVAWSGCSPDALVRMRVIAYEDQEELFGTACDCPVQKTQGTAKLDLGQNRQGEHLLLIFKRS